MLFFNTSRKKNQSSTKRTINLWSHLELTVLVEPRVGARRCCAYLLIENIPVYFSSLFNIVSRDAILPLQNVIRGLLATSFGVM